MSPISRFSRFCREKDPNPGGNGFFWTVIVAVALILGYVIYRYFSLP